MSNILVVMEGSSDGMETPPGMEVTGGDPKGEKEWTLTKKLSGYIITLL